MALEDLRLRNLILGALFHDVGKFLQRSRKFSLSHESLSMLFAFVLNKKIHYRFEGVDWDLVAKLAGYHHESANEEDNDFNQLMKILKEADNLAAASERQISQNQEIDPTQVNQKDIFAYLFYGKNQIIKEYFHHIHPLYLLEKLMPADFISSQENQRHYRLFLGKDDLGLFLSSLLESATEKSFLNFLYALDDIFQIFYVTVPEDRRDNYQLNSLYDHLKLTTLFSYLLYYGRDFHFLSFDIAGIQRFIFNIKATKAAKILRGRSLFIQILTDLIAHRIIFELDLIPQVVINNYGGNLEMFLPDKPGLIDDLNRLVLKISADLLMDYNLSLRVNKYHQKIPLKKETITDLITRNQASAFLKEKSVSSEIFFSLYELNQRIKPEKVDDTSLCVFCENPRNPEKKIVLGGEELIACNQCYLFFAISENIIKEKKPFFPDLKKNLLITDVKLAGDEILFLKPFENLISQQMTKRNYFPQSPSRTLYYTVRNAKGKSFEELVAGRKSAPLLLYLKGDVDDMSKILSEGFDFRKEKVNQDQEIALPPTMTDILHFSRRINLFFQNYLPYLIDNCGYGEKIYLVYSGGDDFFLIGHWEEVLSFIFERFDPAFKEFVCGNPRLTYSLGGVLAKPSDPLFLIAEMVEAKLNLAKAKKEGETKGKFNFLYSKTEVAVWKEIFSYAKGLSQTNAPNSFFYKAFKLADYLKNPKENYHLTKAFYQLSYFYLRLVENNFSQDPRNRYFIEFFEPMITLPRSQTPENQLKIAHLKSIINLVLLWRRKEVEKNG